MGKKVTRKVFKVGDKVEWTSQAGGHETKKVGVVVEVVLPRDYPNRAWSIGRRKYGPFRSSGNPVAAVRDHRSYVVEIRDNPMNIRLSYYWPVVSLLRRVESSETD